MPSNYERKARRSKRQTRLTFDPIDRSSSPANMSHAKVQYEIPGKKQRPTPVSSFTGLVDDSESEDVLSSAMNNGSYNDTPAVPKENQKRPFKPLPTPAKSSQKPTQVDSSFGKFTFHLFSRACDPLEFSTILNWLLRLTNSPR
jgi:hypothetical protein